MTRRTVGAAVFCLLASLTIAANPTPTAAQPTNNQQCVTTANNAETCVSVWTSCSTTAPDPLRAGVVGVVLESRNSTQPVDASVTIGQLETRHVTLTMDRPGPSGFGFAQATGRPDARHPVTVVISGPGIGDSSVQLPELVATTWCGPGPTLACVVGAATVTLMIDNSAGAVALDVAQTDHRGRELIQPIGIVNAGEAATLEFDPASLLRFWIRLRAVDATSDRQELYDETSCSFETVDCASTTPSIPLDECTAVRDVLVGLGADRGTLRDDLCDEVRCANGHVVEISFIEACANFRCGDLAERTLSPSIGRLPRLERLRILYAGVHDVGVTGPIPAELGQLDNLVSLVLQADFDGEIPSELGQLTSLVELNLRDNQLSGSIPPEIAALPSLRSLVLDGNGLDGPVPAALGDLSTLRLVDLSRNNLTGSVPSNLIRDGIEELKLSSNQFVSLPANAGPVTAVAALQTIAIADNLLSGPVPAWLATINVDTIDLSGNNLSGPLPQTIGGLSTRNLDLSDNNITGTIPDSISDITWERPSHYDRTRLDLSDNRLTGSIPAAIAASGLVELALARNELSGSIPALIAGSDIDTLDLEQNQITGIIRQDLFDLTRNSGLRSLNVSGNRLTGELPQTPPMQKFFVADNMLTGTIPNEFGPATELDLSRNALSGSIPARLFNITDYAGFVRTIRIARLGGNSFSGPVPTTLDSLAPWTIDELALLPNGCLTAEASTAAVLPSLGVDPDRLCESPDAQLLCRDRPVTVDIALGQVPTAGDDVILGTPGDDLIAAGDGNDLICGGDGHDTIWGQGGNDEIHGDNGNDRIRGGAGNDLLFGHNGNDDINGGTGNDEVWGQADADGLRGGSGNDLVHGGAGNDWLIAGNGGTDQIYGGDGDDYNITGGPRADTISGGAGNDTITGNGGADTITGNSGNDTIRGGPQSDIIDGGDGNDDCNGGTNNAVIADQATRCETETNIP